MNKKYFDPKKLRGNYKINENLNGDVSFERGFVKVEL